MQQQFEKDMATIGAWLVSQVSKTGSYFPPLAPDSSALPSIRSKGANDWLKKIILALVGAAYQIRTNPSLRDILNELDDLASEQPRSVYSELAESLIIHWRCHYPRYTNDIRNFDEETVKDISCILAFVMKREKNIVWWNIMELVSSDKFFNYHSKLWWIQTLDRASECEGYEGFAASDNLIHLLQEWND